MINIKLKNWKFYEIIGLTFIYLIILYNVVVLKDSPVSAISAFFGITYTMLAGKGIPNCYLFGITGSSFYGYLSFHNALWGNLILYLGYYVPMQILGFFNWKKNLKKDCNEIVKTTLSLEENKKILGFCILGSVVLVSLLIIFNGKSPYFDGITTVLSIVGMYLTVRRVIQQWLIWIIVNGLSAIMWIKIAISGVKVYSTITMWLVYFILAVYFYVTWKRDLNKSF